MVLGRKGSFYDRRCVAESMHPSPTGQSVPRSSVNSRWDVELAALTVRGGAMVTISDDLEISDGRKDVARRDPSHRRSMTSVPYHALTAMR
jgi:hypothetical protein